jgi:hypothetical protein
MNLDLLRLDIRKKVLDDIKSNENILRKKESMIDYEIYNDRIQKYVYDEIVKQTSKATADSMPIVSTINLANRIVNNEATIYNNDPVRTTDMLEADQMALDAVYEDGMFNSKLQKVNKYFKLRKQGFIQVVPKEKGIHLRPLMSHHVDVIPDFQDPEKAFAYIVSAFDRSSYLTTDGNNQSIADQDDYKASLERYVWHTAEYNLVTNGLGDLIGEVKRNPIDELTFIDISKDKDFEFFVRSGLALSEFTVQYNVSWSDFMHTMRLQGFSVPVFTGNAELMPRDYFIGPNRAIMLPADPNNPNNKLDLKFISPTPDLKGALDGMSGLLANFLTSRGVSPKVISAALNASDTYSSGVERLLAMLDKFEATKEDFDLFRSVELKLFNIVKKYMLAFTNTEFLDKKYWLSQSSTNATMNIMFHRPEMIQTEKEKIENLQLKIDMGISDKVLALMDLEGLDQEAAEEKIAKITDRKAKNIQALALNTNKAPLNEAQIN